MGGGCSGLSLVGLLVGVGLTVWLGSMVMDGTLGDDSPKPRNAETLASVVDSPTTAAVSMAISVAPTTDLVGDSEVTITSDAFAAGTEVRVDTCLARSSVVLGDSSPCDPSRESLAVVDGRGHLDVRYVVARVVTAGVTPFDCTSEPGLCVVTVTDTADATRVGSAPLTFRADAERPEITLPD